jgi:hypothetical protein
MANQTPGAAPLQTGKGRATKIPLDYFKKPNRLEKIKLGLTVVALLVAGAWLAWGAFVPSGSGSTRFSHGPVATAHTGIENQCQACHVDFSPMSEQNLFMKHPSAADGKCLDCHKDAVGPTGAHHKTVKPESTASCAGCHRDHRGRDFSLVRMADSDCTNCHKDMKNHMVAGETSVFANTVTSFASHPEFGTFTKGLKDPGKLKFNHKLHMMPGQAPANSTGALTLGKIKQNDESEFARFKNAAWQKDKAETAPVQLDCASCHLSKPAGHGASKAEERYMQPVTYDTNCKACHPLTFDAAVKGTDGKPFALPHGKPLSDTEGVLESAYFNAAIRGNAAEFRGWQRPPGLRPLPGRSIDSGKPPVVLEGVALLDMVKNSASGAARYLEGKAGCAECHTIASNAIVPVNVPDVWMKHAKFSHAAHVAVSCIDCHAGATDSTVSSDVLMPEVKNCQACHSPARAENGKQLGGTRFECTTCHTYHHADNTNAVLGSLRREDRVALEWRSLLQGKTKK